jgi:hypothetical protein
MQGAFAKAVVLGAKMSRDNAAESGQAQSGAAVPPPPTGVSDEERCAESRIWR